MGCGLLHNAASCRFGKFLAVGSWLKNAVHRLWYRCWPKSVGRKMGCAGQTMPLAARDTSALLSSSRFKETSRLRIPGRCVESDGAWCRLSELMLIIDRRVSFEAAQVGFLMNNERPRIGRGKVYRGFSHWRLGLPSRWGSFPSDAGLAFSMSRATLHCLPLLP